MAESEQDITALRQEIRAQRERLIEEKVEKGLAVRKPLLVVAALDPERDYNAVSIDEDGHQLYPPELTVISGVQRGEGSPYVAAPLESDDRYAHVKRIEEKRFAPRPQPVPDPLPSSLRRPVRCTVRGPDPAKDDPGQIIEAEYTITGGNVLRVYADDDRMLGTVTVQPGDD